MPAQLSLLPKPDVIQEKLDSAAARGQKISPWVRQIMRAWAQRNPKLPNTGENAGKNPTGIICIEAGQLPIPCDCFYCGEPAVIFPPEDGTDPRGMCICPCCSGPSCPHKDKKRVAA